MNFLEAIDSFEYVTCAYLQEHINPTAHIYTYHEGSSFRNILCFRLNSKLYRFAVGIPDQIYNSEWFNFHMAKCEPKFDGTFGMMLDKVPGFMLSGFLEGLKVSKDIVLPDYIYGIGYKAFDHSDIRSIKLHHGLEYIGNYAFYCCKDLVSIEIPDTVIEIGTGAFSLCYSLRYVKLPILLEKLPDEAFRDCRDIEDIYIPDSVRYIGYHAFFRCIGLKKGKKTIMLPHDFDMTYLQQKGCGMNGFTFKNRP